MNITVGPLYCSRSYIENMQTVLPYLSFEPHFLELAPLLVAGHAILHQEEGDAVCGGLGLRVRESDYDDNVRQPSIGDERLAAIQDPIIAIALCMCPDSLKVTVVVHSSTI